MNKQHFKIQRKHVFSNFMNKLIFRLYSLMSIGIFINFLQVLLDICTCIFVLANAILVIIRWRWLLGAKLPEKSALCMFFRSLWPQSLLRPKHAIMTQKISCTFSEGWATVYCLHVSGHQRITWKSGVKHWNLVETHVKSLRGGWGLSVLWYWKQYCVGQAKAHVSVNGYLYST